MYICILPPGLLYLWLCMSSTKCCSTWSSTMTKQPWSTISSCRLLIVWFTLALDWKSMRKTLHMLSIIKREREYVYPSKAIMDHAGEAEPILKHNFIHNIQTFFYCTKITYLYRLDCRMNPMNSYSHIRYLYWVAFAVLLNARLSRRYIHNTWNYGTYITSIDHYYYHHLLLLLLPLAHTTNESQRASHREPTIIAPWPPILHKALLATLSTSTSTNHLTNQQQQQ